VSVLGVILSFYNKLSVYHKTETNYIWKMQNKAIEGVFNKHVKHWSCWH